MITGVSEKVLAIEDKSSHSKPKSISKKKAVTSKSNKKVSKALASNDALSKKAGAESFAFTIQNSTEFLSGKFESVHLSILEC